MEDRNKIINQPRKLFRYYTIIMLATFFSIWAVSFLISEELKNSINENNLLFASVRQNLKTIDALNMIGLIGMLFGAVCLLLVIMKPASILETGKIEDPHIPKDLGEQIFKQGFLEYDLFQNPKYYRWTELSEHLDVQRKFFSYLLKIGLLDEQKISWSSGHGYKLKPFPKTEEQKKATEFVRSAESILYYNENIRVYWGFTLYPILFVFIAPLIIISVNPASWINWLLGIATLIFFAFNLDWAFVKLWKGSRLIYKAKAVLCFLKDQRHGDYRL